MLGFDAEELAKLLDPGVEEGLTDPDEIPAPPDEATTLGDDDTLDGGEVLPGFRLRLKKLFDRVRDGR